VSDALAFESAYATFRPAIRRHLARLVGETDADDLTQEVFVKTLDGMADLRNGGSLKAWLYRVATNAALDRLRQRSRAGIAQPLESFRRATWRSLARSRMRRTAWSSASTSCAVL
jgi:RNA polymerase sigma factor (sigma-70 family)